MICDTVRYVLFRWGFIGTFRVDNGAPFGEPTRQSLSPLHLYLNAHGIRVKLNPPRSPRKNAKVERNQGTTARWANPAQCVDYLEFQQKLNQAVIDQRENYPSRVCQGLTRAQRYPKLFDNPKRFNVADFDLNRVFQLLSKGHWVRKVSAYGSASIFGKAYQIGYKYRNTVVDIYFEPKTRHWIVKDARGININSLHAKNLNEINIRALSLSQ